MNLTPTNKVTAGAGIGMLVTIIAWYLKTYEGIALPPDVQAAFTGILYFVVQWSVSDEKS